MRPAAKLAAKVLAALAASAVALALGLRAGGVWTPGRATLIALITTSAVLTAGVTIAAALGEWWAQRNAYRSVQSEVLLEATAWAIVDATGLDFRDLGLAAYVVRQNLRHPWSSRHRHLHRVQRVRAKRRPSSSRVDWRPGVGVIGTCVADGQLVAQDLAADYAAVWPCTAQEWDELVDDDIKHGLTFADFLDVREKYGVVIATPILDDRASTTRVIGCVSLDGPVGSFARLTEQDVEGLLDSAAQSLLRLAVRPR